MTPRWTRLDGFALGGLLALPLLWYYTPLFTDACYYLGDLIGQYDPWWSFGHESLREGRFPLWNPYVFGGTPYHVNPENALFYPLKLPLVFLSFFKAAAILRALNAMVASVGAYLLLRAYGTRPVSGVFGALIFSYGSFMAYEWVHIPYVNTAVWFPWQLLFLERLLRRRRPIDAVGLAVVTALCFLGGSPGIFLVCQMTLSFYFVAGLVRLVLGRRRDETLRLLVLIGLAALLVVGLTAVLLVPAMEFIAQTPRSGGLQNTENFYRFSTIPQALKTLVFPWTHHRYGAPYPPVYPNPFLYVPYLGFGAVLLAFFNLRSRRYARLAPVTLAVVAFSALAALGTHTGLLPWMMSKLTLFNWFRWPHDYLLMSYLALSIAAATGFDALWRARGSRLRRFGPLAALYLLAGLLFAPWISTLAVVLAIGAAVALALLLRHLLGSALRPERARAVLGAAVLLLVAADLFAYTRELRIYLPREALQMDHAREAIDWLEQNAPGERVSFSAPGGGTYFSQSERIFTRYLPLVDEPRVPEPLLRRHRELTSFDHWRDRVRAREVDGWLDQRGIAFEDMDDYFWTWPVNAGMRFRYEEVSGYDPFVSARALELFRKLPFHRTWDLLGVRHVVTPNRVSIEGLEPAARPGGLYVWRNPDASPRVTVPARVEGAIHPKEILRRMAEPGFDPVGMALFERSLPDDSRNAATPPDTAPGRATLLERAPERVALRAEMERPGYVVLHDVYHPAWEVRVNGEEAELLRADYLLRAVRLPQGSHSVEFRYRPRSLLLSAWVSAACWVGVIAGMGIVIFGRSRRRAPRPAPRPLGGRVLGTARNRPRRRPRTA